MTKWHTYTKCPPTASKQVDQHILYILQRTVTAKNEYPSNLQCFYMTTFPSMRSNCQDRSKIISIWCIVETVFFPSASHSMTLSVSRCAIAYFRCLLTSRFIPILRLIQLFIHNIAQKSSINNLNLLGTWRCIPIPANVYPEKNECKQ